MKFLYTSNNGFVPQIATGMMAVLENHKNVATIEFYVISDGISEENKMKITGMVEKYQRKIYFLELGNIKKFLDFDFDTFHWDNIILARLLLDKYLPYSVERIIYLDGDTLVRGNIEDMWHIDLKGKVLGASIEPTVDKKRKQKLGISDDLPYYNSGVLLIDMNLWRERNIGEKLIDFYRAYDGKLYAADQDAINGALKNEIHVISPKYNFYNIHYLYPYKLMKKLTAPAQYIDEMTYDEAVKDPKIIHFLGEDRPWRKHCHHLYKKDYEYYLSLTPWKNVPKQNDLGLYLTCFWILNIITKPCPIIRVKIIEWLSPTMDKQKAKK